MKKVVVINCRPGAWTEEISQETTVFFSGEVWRGRDRFSRGAACGFLREIFGQSFPLSDEKIKAILEDLRGHFAFVYVSPDKMIAAVDRIRSIPLFYGEDETRLVISNSARAVKHHLQLTGESRRAVAEFRLAGYTLGHGTLAEGVSQLLAGEAYCFDKKTERGQTIDYFRYWPTELFAPKQETLLDDMHGLYLEVFRDLVESLDGRPAWIPLSGGLDSRWILAMLLELKYDRIETFSYGCPGHPEITRAKAIAKRLGVSWRPVVLTREQTRPRYFSEDRRKYFTFADGLCSIPVLNDYYPLQMLKEQGAVPPDAVIINGQSGDYLTGGHIPAALVSEETVSAEDLLKALTKKHLDLWSDPQAKAVLPQVQEDLLGGLGLSGEDRCPRQEMAQYYEFWEWRERQTKFVVNGQRVYEWLGFDWRLPLWDDRLLFFWRNVPWQQKIGQRLQKEYLTRKNFKGVFEGDWMKPHPLNWKDRAKFWPLIVYSKLAGKDISGLVRQYVMYGWHYAPYYYQRTYREYLKDSRWHRNPFSYLVKDYLAEDVLAQPDACSTT